MRLPSVSTLADYGGAKANYAPVEDASTDEDASNRNDYVGDVAGMSNTAVRAWVTFLGTATEPISDPATNVHGAVWGSAANVKPTIERDALGTYVVIWPETFIDDLGVEHTINIRGVLRPNIQTEYLYHSSAVVAAANAVGVYVWAADGTPSDAVGLPITVCVY